MTNYDKFISLFPLEGEVTEAILKKGNVDDTGKCYGALTLKKALGRNFKLIEDPNCIWGNDFGQVKVDGATITITTRYKLGFMNLTKPRKVVFIIKNNHGNRKNNQRSKGDIQFCEFILIG